MPTSGMACAQRRRTVGVCVIREQVEQALVASALRSAHQVRDGEHHARVARDVGLNARAKVQPLRSTWCGDGVGNCGGAQADLAGGSCFSCPPEARQATQASCAACLLAWREAHTCGLSTGREVPATPCTEAMVVTMVVVLRTRVARSTERLRSRSGTVPTAMTGTSPPNPRGAPAEGNARAALTLVAHL